MNGRSVLRLDGFTRLFFKHCWEIVGIDLVRAVQYMFSSRSFPAGINSIFTVLLPKVDNAEQIEQFRPIELGNFVFKVVTRIMACKLAPIISRIVTPNQFGFVPGRHIESCIVGASECVNLMNRQSIGRNMAFKVDIRKALDTLNWDFFSCSFAIIWVLRYFCVWIHSLLLSARVSISFNAPRTQGVRQGDPLSLLLFVLAKEFLSMLLLRRLDEGKL